MSEDRHIACDHQVEKKLLQLGRRRVVRRLNQHVAGIGDGKELAGAKAGDEIRSHVNVRSSSQPKRDSFFIENILELQGGLPDSRTGIMVQSR